MLLNDRRECWVKEIYNTAAGRPTVYHGPFSQQMVRLTDLKLKTCSGFRKQPKDGAEFDLTDEIFYWLGLVGCIVLLHGRQRKLYLTAQFTLQIETFREDYVSVHLLHLQAFSLPPFVRCICLFCWFVVVLVIH